MALKKIEARVKKVLVSAVGCLLSLLSCSVGIIGALIKGRRLRL
jgi:hypothetical protein